MLRLHLYFKHLIFLIAGIYMLGRNWYLCGNKGRFTFHDKNDGCGTWTPWYPSEQHLPQFNENSTYERLYCSICISGYRTSNYKAFSYSWRNCWFCTLFVFVQICYGSRGQYFCGWRLFVQLNKISLTIFVFQIKCC